ncbi:MAG: efflux RND transporter permease subunit [Candidatus Zixiibacteriota bacterium]|nr:MAG: efflux RND transporter permease subunit [candidate division Zixibacteria bacterium]
MIRFIIRRPILVSMLIAALCLLGAVSYYHLPVENQPSVELPLLIVAIGSARDADPKYVERHAVIPLESAIAGLEDIERIESYINRGRTIVLAYYSERTDLRFAYLKLQQRVGEVRSTLDGEFFVTVWKIDTEQLANQFMSLEARGSGSLDQIRNVVDRKVASELENIDGVANVAIYGGRTHSVEVILDEETLEAHGLTPAQVSQAISGGSRQRDYLGQAIEGDRQFAVNLATDYTSVSNLGEIVLRSQGPIQLKHVAQIIDGAAEETSISRVNGLESISITLMRDRQANLLDLSNRTRDAIDNLNSVLEQSGVELVIRSDSSDDIRENIGTIKQLALIGGLLAVLVLWIFLRNLPLVLVIAATIPVSVLIALNFFYLNDITINTLSLFGIAIALGMLLDNSIVVLENIHRQVARGKEALQAVVTGAGEVWRPVLAATLTTVAVFLPFVFSSNFLVRTLGRHIGVSVISTLLVSLGIAFLLIPAFSYRFLKHHKGLHSPAMRTLARSHRMQQIYTLFLKSCFRFPARTAIVSVVLLFLSIVICLRVSMSVPEEIETDRFSLYATLPSGTTLTSADDQAVEMDKRLSEIPEIDERLANVEEDNIAFTFRLKEDFEEIGRRNLEGIKEEMIESLEDAFPRVDFSYEQPTGDARYRGGGRDGFGGQRAFSRLLGIGTTEERVVIRGENLELLQTVADDIQYNIDNLETVRRSRTTVGRPRPGIDLMLDHAALNYFDVSPSTLVSEFGSFNREFSSGATLRSGGEDIDIIIKSSQQEDRTSDDLRQLDIPSASGGTVPILQLSRLVYTSATPNINRANQEKEIEIVYRFEAEIEESKQLLEAARLSVEQIVDDMSLPAGVSVEVIHDEMDFSDFYFLIAAAVILIFMILSSVFESLIQPLVIMFAIPLATIGAFWGLILTGNSLLNANALIGFLILLGVVVNNGIILIDYSRLLNRRGFRPARALLSAGQARMRPILITAITTVLGMLPLAMGKAEFVAAIGAPFAITVIGGLAFATLFTLLLIPTFSFSLDRVLRWWRQLDWKIKSVQVAALAGGLVLIYFNVESTLWRIGNMVTLLGGIPAFTYFAMTSLRRTRARIIPQDEPIRITVRNVVKFYDDFPRFIREWRKGDRRRQRLERSGLQLTAGRRVKVGWHPALYAFLFYFAYMYLESGFWILMTTAGFYVYTVALGRRLLAVDGVYGPGMVKRLLRALPRILFWGLPLANLVWFYTLGFGLPLTIIIGVTWYLAVLIYNTSQRLYRDRIEIARITGRFRRLRKAFYRFVKIIPLIGKRKIPFRALDQVSMEIGSGMFGLVGPNGAGKTTLMRVICGVLEGTRGTVTINGLDMGKYREELQSLIGYLPQEFGTYENMTAYQFLDYQALLKGLWDSDERAEIVNRAVGSVHLDDSKNIKIKSFSGGMKQRVGIAQTLLHLPRILVVDEPTAGLDPRERIRFRNLLSDLARDRIVIFSTHIIEDISSSCNLLAVLADGEVKFLGSPGEMVDLTRGSVWQVTVSEDSFDDVRRRLRIVHHMRDGEMIRIRVLADEKPLPEAIPVTPTLEDSYLQLLDQKEEA